MASYIAQAKKTYIEKKIKEDDNWSLVITTTIMELFELLTSTFSGLPTGCFGDDSILVTEVNTDGSFLISHFLSLSLKRNVNVCFLTLSQSFGHYRNVCGKLGSNLNNDLDSGSLKVLNGLKQIGATMCGLPSNSLWNNIMDSKNLKELFLEIKKVVEDFSKPFIICIDDLSIFLSLGFDYKAIYEFVHQLRQLCKKNRSFKCCIITLIHLPSTDPEEDSDIYKLCTYLSEHSNIVINCSALQTGRCKEVHGQV